MENHIYGIPNTYHYWRREWQPTPVFLPGKLHGQRNLEVYSPWGYKESDTTEPLSLRYIPETVARCFTLYIYIYNFYYFLAAPSNMQDICSPTRDQTQAPSVEARSPSHRTTREVLVGAFLLFLIYTWFLGEGNGTPLQYSCRENPMNRGAWWAAVHGVARVGHDWATSLSLFTFMHWRRDWQPTPVFLPGESQGQGSLMGCRP